MIPLSIIIYGIITVTEYSLYNVYAPNSKHPPFQIVNQDIIVNSVFTPLKQHHQIIQTQLL